MRLLWTGKWIDAPRPHPVAGSVAIEVEATVPIAPLGAAHGRRLERPLRKLVSFAVTDGVGATARKARSKRAEAAYTGDYHLVAVLGTSDDRRVVALAPRSPRCAQWLLAPEALVRPAPDAFGATALEGLAAHIGARADALAPHLSQSYLYSGMEPPPELTAALDEAVAAPTATATATPAIRPPGNAAAPATPPIPSAGEPPLAILGAGDYVRIEVAPALAFQGLRRAAIADREPQIAALAAEQLAFPAAFTDAAAAIDALPQRGLVVVATAHDSHAALAAQALAAGHRVICEKPAVVHDADLDLLEAAAEKHPGELEIGFNRRHNPIVERARNLLAAESGPVTLTATVREVDITPDHWYLWPNQGTRVAGNLCHWIDLAFHLIGPGPRGTSLTVSPRVSDGPMGLDADRAFTFALDDGSSVSLLPTSRGDAVRGVQEQIEVRRGELTLRIDDLWHLRGTRAGRPIFHRTAFRDKGHGRMYADAVGRFTAGQPARYPLADLRRVGEVQLAATALLRSGEASGTVGAR